MASRITIFEPHFEGAQFGPASLGDQTEEHDADERSGMRFLLLVLALALTLGYLAVQYRSEDTNDTEAEDRLRLRPLL